MLETSDSRDEILIRYILNETSKNENEEIEDQIFLNEELSERAQVVEMLLIERYVLGELSDEEKARFEKGFLLLPENREKVEEARMFQESLGLLRRERLAQESEAQRASRRSRLASWLRMPMLAPALAVLVLLLIGAAVLLFYMREKQRTLANANGSSSNNANQVAIIPNQNSSNNAAPPTNNNGENPVQAQAPSMNSSPTPPAPRIARKNPEVGIAYPSRMKERSGTAGQSMGPENVRPQVLNIPANSEQVSLSLELGATEVTDSNRQIPVEIQNDKIQRVYPLKMTETLSVSPTRIPGTQASSPKYMLTIVVPANLLKENEIYYFVIPDPSDPKKSSTTPFQITRAKP